MMIDSVEDLHHNNCASSTKDSYDPTKPTADLHNLSESFHEKSIKPNILNTDEPETEDDWFKQSSNSHSPLIIDQKEGSFRPHQDRNNANNDWDSGKNHIEDGNSNWKQSNSGFNDYSHKKYGREVRNTNKNNSYGDSQNKHRGFQNQYQKHSDGKTRNFPISTNADRGDINWNNAPKFHKHHNTDNFNSNNNNDNFQYNQFGGGWPAENSNHTDRSTKVGYIQNNCENNISSNNDIGGWDDDNGHTNQTSEDSKKQNNGLVVNTGNSNLGGDHIAKEGNDDWFNDSADINIDHIKEDLANNLQDKQQNQCDQNNDEWFADSSTTNNPYIPNKNYPNRKYDDRNRNNFSNSHSNIQKNYNERHKDSKFIRSSNDSFPKKFDTSDKSYHHSKKFRDNRAMQDSHNFSDFGRNKDFNRNRNSGFNLAQSDNQNNDFNATPRNSRGINSCNDDWGGVRDNGRSGRERVLKNVHNFGNHSQNDFNNNFGDHNSKLPYENDNNWNQKSNRQSNRSLNSEREQINNKYQNRKESSHNGWDQNSKINAGKNQQYHNYDSQFVSNVNSKPTDDNLDWDEPYTVDSNSRMSTSRNILTGSSETNNTVLVKEFGKSFLHINSNIYPTDYKPLVDLEKINCRCSSNVESKSCTSQCVNKWLKIECNQNCPFGSSCSNKSLQENKLKSVQPLKTAEKGWSLIVIEDVNPNDLIIEMVGSIILKSNYLVTKKNSEDDNQYCFALGSNHIIDMEQKSNLARYINHSCEPNCRLETWCVNGFLRLGIFSTSHISPNSELTIDYRDSFLYPKLLQCFCGAEKCRGKIGDFTKKFFKSFFSTQNSNISESSLSGSFNDGEEMLTMMKHAILEQEVEKDFIMQFLTSLHLNFGASSLKKLFLSYHGLILLKRWLCLQDDSMQFSPLTQGKSFFLSEDLRSKVFDIFRLLDRTCISFIEESGIIEEFRVFSNAHSKVLQKNLLTVDEIAVKRVLVNINELLEIWLNVSKDAASSPQIKSGVPSNLTDISLHAPVSSFLPPPIVLPYLPGPFQAENLAFPPNKDTIQQSNSSGVSFNNLSNEQLASILNNATTTIQPQNIQSMTETDKNLKLAQDNITNTQNLSPGIIPEKEVSAKSLEGLPQNWMSSTTPFGKKYYFNTVTKHTQWEMPTIPKEDLEQSSPSKKSKSQSVNNISSSLKFTSASAIKFKKETSQFIVSLLSLYLKGKMSYGRIKSVDDFKFLARNLTHLILTKEIEKKGESNIVFDEKTKDRTSEYISNFMKKQGSVYKRAAE